MSRAVFTLLSFFLVLASCQPAVIAEKSVDEKGVSAEVKIMASPEYTYRALRAMRDEDPSGCRVLSSSKNESVVEEVFDGLPVIGKATCIYRETYEPSRKLSFKMIRSDKLKAFEGEWTLQPVDNGEHTLVKLTSYIDTGVKVPFAKQVTEIASAREVKLQLADLKKSAELKKEKRCSVSERNQSL